MLKRLMGMVVRLGVLVGALIALFRTLIRPRILHWGAVADEPIRSLPGDEVIADSPDQPTNAITIYAPPEAVWPWLVQMGCTRAGWYAYDLLDNGGKPSAEKIIPALQEIKQGDILPSTPDGEIGFTVLDVEPLHHLVLGSAVYTTSGEPVEIPGIASNGTWTFVLEPLGEDATRLITRFRMETQQSQLLEWTVGSAWDVAHFIMQRRQLLGIKERVEGGTLVPTA